MTIFKPERKLILTLVSLMLFLYGFGSLAAVEAQTQPPETSTSGDAVIADQPMEENAVDDVSAATDILTNVEDYPRELLDSLVLERHNSPPPVQEDIKIFYNSGFGSVMLAWNVPENSNDAGYDIYRRIKRFSNGFEPEITIDGDMSDWDGIKSANTYPYPSEDPLHIQDIWITQDGENLYLYYLFSSNIEDAAITNFFIDVDRDYSTGSGTKNWRGLPIGAEVMFYYSHPGSVYRKQWDSDWKGPFPYQNFISGNFADPDLAWITPYDMTWTGLAAVGSSGETFKGETLPNDGMEIKIPFADLEAITGYAIDPDRFGADFVFSTNFDQFPTIGYGAKSPMYYTYGYEKLNTQLITESSFADTTAIDGVTYEYTIYRHDQAGNEYPAVSAPFTISRNQAQVLDFNIMILDETTLEIDFTFPENPKIEEAVIVRRSDRYPETPTDGDIAARVQYGPGKSVTIQDTHLESGVHYFYSAFSISLIGEYTKASWITRDRSIPAKVRGPIENFQIDDDYMVYFSSWDAERVAAAKRYDIVILHPGGGSPLINRKQVDEIQRGLDGEKGTSDDVRVIGYVSIGEDFGINPDIIAANSENGIFPGYEDYPEGPWSLKGYNYPRKSVEDTYGPVSYSYENDVISPTLIMDSRYRFPSYYVDMIDYSGQGGAGQDGLPDQNIEWGGLFVDPGNITWQNFIKTARIETEFIAGIDWVLGTDDGALGCDGIFLDTVGVSATWSQWFPYTFYGDYFWTRDGALDFMARIGLWYPDTIIIPNRPMHFVFEDFIGKRYDDFRSLVNAIFWESYSADVDFWWGGTYADIFEDAVIHSQDSSDGRGFSTLTLDYWQVMIDAEEGGEYQRAPWYQDISQLADRAEESGFIPYVSGSRSLADTTDYIYFYRHPDKRILPDLFVHSIEAEEMSDGLVSLDIILSNQGSETPENRQIQVQIMVNDTVVKQVVIPSLTFLEQFSIPLVIPKSSIGTLVTVEIDPENILRELDEIPGRTDPNNIKSRYLERYLYPREGWYPEGFSPDITVPEVNFSTEYPVVGEEMDVLISYENYSSEGIAPDTRMYLWFGDALKDPELRNIIVPYLMPGETKIVTVPFIPRVPGSLSVGIVADGSVKVMEQNETNNTASASTFVYGSFGDESIIDWTQEGVVDRILGNGDIEGLLPAVDIVSTSLFADSENIYVRLEASGVIDPKKYLYLIFLDIDKSGDSGYSIQNIGADINIMNGSLGIYTGEAGSWSWNTKFQPDLVDMRIGNEKKVLEYKIAKSALEMVLGSEISSKISAVSTISDQENSTVDDISPQIQFPPVGLDLLIDGYFTDWEQNSLKSTVVFDGSDDGYDASGLFVGSELDDFADIQKITLYRDTEFLYGMIETYSAAVAGDTSWSMFLDIDGNLATGYAANWGSLGAEYLFQNGNLLSWAGNSGGDWLWKPKVDSCIAFSQGKLKKNLLEFAIPRNQIEWLSDSPITLYFQMLDVRGAGWEDDYTDNFPEFGEDGILFP